MFNSPSCNEKFAFEGMKDWLTSAFWREFTVKAVGEAGANVGADQKVSRSAAVLDHRTNVEVSSQDGGIGWSLRLSAGRGTWKRRHVIICRLKL